MQNDDPLTNECPDDFKKTCKLSCYIQNGKPTCGCLPGYTQKEEKCIGMIKCIR